MGGVIPPKNKSHSLIFYTLLFFLTLTLSHASLHHTPVPPSLPLSPSPSLPLVPLMFFLTFSHGRAADPRYVNFGLHGVQPHAARGLCLALHKADLFAMVMIGLAFQIKHMAMVRGGIPDVRADKIKIFPGHCVQFRFLALRLN